MKQKHKYTGVTQLGRNIVDWIDENKEFLATRVNYLSFNMSMDRTNVCCFGWKYKPVLTDGRYGVSKRENIPALFMLLPCSRNPIYKDDMPYLYKLNH